MQVHVIGDRLEDIDGFRIEKLAKMVRECAVDRLFEVFHFRIAMMGRIVCHGFNIGEIESPKVGRVAPVDICRILHIFG
jgi:hypothetical protein